MSFETISVIGLGYIGLPTAAMFASRKKKVIGVDINQHAVDTINQGKIHIVEPDLDMLVYAAVTKGYLQATSVPEPADAFLIAVPTPFLPIENEGDIPNPDLKYIESAAKAIAPVLKKGDSSVEVLRTDQVGSQVGKELTEKGVLNFVDIKRLGVSFGMNDRQCFVSLVFANVSFFVDDAVSTMSFSLCFFRYVDCLFNDLI